MAGKWLRTLFKEKPINKTKQNGLQLQGWKQRELGGSGNLIRGGADVLNLSKVTRSLDRPAPEVIEHWCFHWAAAAALCWRDLEWKLGLNPLSVLLGFDSKPKRLRDGRGNKTKPEKSMHVEWHLDTKAGIWSLWRPRTNSSVWRVAPHLTLAWAQNCVFTHTANCDRHTVEQRFPPQTCSSHTEPLLVAAHNQHTRFLRQEQRTIVSLSVERIALQP